MNDAEVTYHTNGPLNFSHSMSILSKIKDFAANDDKRPLIEIGYLASDLPDDIWLSILVEDPKKETKTITLCSVTISIKTAKEISEMLSVLIKQKPTEED
jgi:hypothetical protein